MTLWKRLGRGGGAKQVHIGYPLLLETTMDEKALEGYKTPQEVLLERTSPVNNIIIPVTAVSAHSLAVQSLQGYKTASTSEFLREDLVSRDTKLPHPPPPPASAVAQHERQRLPRPVSEIPTTSSLYSQPSPDPQLNHGHYGYEYGDDDSDADVDLFRPQLDPANARYSMAAHTTSSVYSDISPPDSPETYARHASYDPYRNRGDNGRGSGFTAGESPDISPIDEQLPEGVIPPLNTKPRQIFTSHLPVALRNLGGNDNSMSTGGQFEQQHQAPSQRQSQTQGTAATSAASKGPTSSDSAITTRTTPVLSSIPRKPARNSIGGANQQTFAQRSAAEVGSKKAKGLGIDTYAARPDWKGASGRQTTVAPIQDKPRNSLVVKPLTLQKVPVPARNASSIAASTATTSSHTGSKGHAVVDARIQSASSSDRGNNDSGTSTPTTVISRRGMESSEPAEQAETVHVSSVQGGMNPERTSTFNPHDTPRTTIDKDIRPIVPLKAGNNTPPKKPSSPASATIPSQQLPFSNAERRKPTPTQSGESIPPARSPIPFDPSGFDEIHRAEAFNLLTGAGISSMPTQQNNFRQADSPSDTAHFTPTAVAAALEDHPPSRFSFTTYATSTNDHSVPSTPDISTMPGTFGDYSPLPSPSSPILSRKRPVTSTTNNSKATARKPTPSQLLLSLTSTKPVPKNDAAWRDSKALPPPPPPGPSEDGTIAAEDPIAALQAKLDHEQARRSNLQRLIHDFSSKNPAAASSTLTSGSGPGRLSAGGARFSISRDKLAALREELTDVQAKEHELGLRLHRAWRRRDEKECREPTLWVRRVTS